MILEESIQSINNIILDYFDVSHDPFSIGILDSITAAFARNYLTCHLIIMLMVKKRTALMISYLKEMISASSIRQTLCIYSKICDVVTLINKCFAMHLILLFYNSVFISILVVFSFCDMFMVEDIRVGHVTFFITGANVILFQTLLVVTAVYFSDNINSLGAKLFDIITSNESSSNADYLKWSSLASLQFNHQTSTISSGLFIVKWTFLSAVIASIFSNVIIMLQFYTS